ncbi:MAG: T9SS type A sorting domain-containing protein [Nocardioidaceae bacterium]
MVSAAPNPSASYFNLSAQGTFDEPVEIKVVNQMGNVIETRKGMPAKGNLQIGITYRPGIYFVEFSQGGEKVVLKLDKQSN